MTKPFDQGHHNGWKSLATLRLLLPKYRLVTPYHLGPSFSQGKREDRGSGKPRAVLILQVPLIGIFPSQQSRKEMERPT